MTLLRCRERLSAPSTVANAFVCYHAAPVSSQQRHSASGARQKRRSSVRLLPGLAKKTAPTWTATPWRRDAGMTGRLPRFRAYRAITASARRKPAVDFRNGRDHASCMDTSDTRRQPTLKAGGRAPECPVPPGALGRSVRRACSPTPRTRRCSPRTASCRARRRSHPRRAAARACPSPRCRPRG